MKIPTLAPIGNPHIICDTTSYTVLSTGQTVTTNRYGQPLNGDALARALTLHGFPGVVVHVTGNQHKGLNIGDPNQNIGSSVWWGNGPVRDITVVGTAPSAKIRNISDFDQVGTVRLHNIVLENRPSAHCPFVVNMGFRVGRMILTNIGFIAEDPTAWGGKGMKWNIRGHGSASWYIANTTFHKAEEHATYIDNVQGDSYFLGLEGSGYGRTFMQFTNRQESGPTAFGDLVLMNCKTSNNFGQGGSDFTFVGQGEGNIWCLNCESIGAPTGSNGAFVHWTDYGHGAYLTQRGFTTGGLVLWNFKCNHPAANRDHISIAGVENVIVGGFPRKSLIKGNKVGISLDGEFGGGINNGTVMFCTPGSPVSQWPAWQTGIKARKRIQGQYHNYTDTELDNMYGPPWINFD